LLSCNKAILNINFRSSLNRAEQELINKFSLKEGKAQILHLAPPLPVAHATVVTQDDEQPLVLPTAIAVMDYIYDPSLFSPQRSLSERPSASGSDALYTTGAVVFALGFSVLLVSWLVISTAMLGILIGGIMAGLGMATMCAARMTTSAP
jgi:hypothetical protein